MGLIKVYENKATTTRTDDKRRCERELPGSLLTTTMKVGCHDQVSSSHHTQRKKKRTGENKDGGRLNGWCECGSMRSGPHEMRWRLRPRVPVRACIDGRTAWRTEPVTIGSNTLDTCMQGDLQIATYGSVPSAVTVSIAPVIAVPDGARLSSCTQLAAPASPLCSPCGEANGLHLTSMPSTRGCELCCPCTRMCTCAASGHESDKPLCEQATAGSGE